MNFSDYLTLEHFKKILIHDQVETEKIDNAWRSEHKKIINENFEEPLLAFLVAKRDNQGLAKVQYSEGHITRLSEAWNNFVDSKESTRKREIPDAFYKVVSNSTFNYEKEALTPEFIDSRYNKFIEKFNNGNFKHFELSEDACQCYDCGQRFKPVIQSWAPTFNVFEKKADGSLDYRSLVKPESCLSNNVEEVKVNFPTGELIVADWIRIEEFTKGVDYQGEDKWSDEKSINFAKGRIFMTKFYAQENNFVHVSVGNSSPHVFQNGDSLVVGCQQYNEEKDDYEELPSNSAYKEAARVCTDLWGVTIVDKQTLVEIISKKLGDKAVETVEEYLKEDTNHEIVTVNPGDYTLKFHGNYPEFNDAIKDNDLPGEIEKFFTVTSAPKPQNKKKM